MMRALRRAVIPLCVLILLGISAAAAQSPQDLFEEAKRLEQLGDLPGALDRLQRILPLLPDGDNRAIVQIATGNILLKQGKRDEAMGYLEQGLRVVQNSQAKALALADIGSIQAARRYYSEALSSLRKALETSNDADLTVAATIRIASVLFLQCKLGEAEQELVKAVELSRTNARRSEALGRLAGILFAEGRWQESVDRSTQAVAAAPNASAKALALLSLGDAYRAQNNYREAWSAYESARTTAEDDATKNAARRGLSLVLTGEGRLRQAKAELDAIVSQSGPAAATDEKFETRAKALLDSAEIALNTQRDRARAESLLQEAMRSSDDPEIRPVLLNRLGSVRAEDGKLNDALASYSEAEKLACMPGDKADALVGLGVVLRRLGRLPEAESKLEAGLPLVTNPSGQVWVAVNLFNIRERWIWPFLLIIVGVLAAAGTLAYQRVLRPRGITFDAFPSLRRPLQQMAAGAVGAVIGFLAYILYDYFFVSTAYLVDQGFIRSVLYGATPGILTRELLFNRGLDWIFVAVLTGSIISAEGWRHPRLPPRLLRAVGWAALTGGIGGIAADMLGTLLRQQLAPLTITKTVAIAGLTLALWGALLGLGIALSYGSRDRIRRAVIGGCVGGLLGGVVFYPIWAALLDVLPFDDIICFSCLLRLALMGAGIGLALGLTDVRWPDWSHFTAPGATAVQPPAQAPSGSVADAPPSSVPAGKQSPGTTDGKPISPTADLWGVTPTATPPGPSVPASKPPTPPGPQADTTVPADKTPAGGPVQDWWLDQAPPARPAPSRDRPAATTPPADPTAKPAKPPDWWE